MLKQDRTSEFLESVKCFVNELDIFDIEFSIGDFSGDSEAIKALNASVENCKMYEEHICKKFDINKLLPVVEQIWIEYGEKLSCIMIYKMFGILELSLLSNSAESITTGQIERIFKLVENVLKSKIKLNHITVRLALNVTVLLLKIIAKDYFQEIDVKQTFIMLWNACINTIEPNDDPEVIRQKVNLVLYSLMVFINDLNKYHKTETKGVASELVKYVWNEGKNVWYDENFPDRNQDIVERMLFLLALTLKYEDIANFAVENFTDILSLATDVLNLDFWLNLQSSNSMIYCSVCNSGYFNENTLIVFHTFEVLLELSQIGKKWSTLVNNQIKKFGLEIENDTIVIKDKNVLDSFYGDKFKDISRKIEAANREHIKNKSKDGNKIDQENKIVEQPNIEKDKKLDNTNQSVSLKNENQKVIETNTQKEEADNKPTYTNDRILEEIENAYCQNREIDNNISPDELCSAIKSSERYYYYAAMLPYYKYNEIKKDLSFWMCFVIFFYSLILFRFYNPQKDDAYKQLALNKDKNKVFSERQNAIEQPWTQITRQNKENNEEHKK